MSSDKNLNPLGIVRVDAVDVEVFTVKLTVARGDLREYGKYPKTFACETTESLNRAVSMNASFATIFK